MTADPQDLLRLADAVEKATGPDRELDAAIAIAIGAGRVASSFSRGYDKDGAWSYEGLSLAEAVQAFPARKAMAAIFFGVEKYTASLDAAMTLVPEGQESAVLHEAWRAVSNNHALHVRFWKRDADGDYAQALARQIVAAALRARAHFTKESDNG